MVINVSCFFFQVKLYPVVKANKLITSSFSNKDMLKTAGVVSPKQNKTNLVLSTAFPKFYMAFKQEQKNN